LRWRLRLRPLNRSSAVELRRPVVVYLLSFLVLGLSVSILGPALSELRDRSGADLGGIGVLFVGQSVGYIIGSFVAGRLYDRFDGHIVYSWALVALAVGIGALPSLDVLSTLFLTFVLVGVGSSTVDVGANTLLMWQLGGQVGRPMNILHLCFGVGALSAPLVVYIGLDFAAYLAAALCLALAVLMTAIPAPIAPTVVRDEQTDTTRPMLALLSLFFCLYVGLEVGFAGWIHTYGEEIDFSALAATWLTTAFWVGFTVGRLLSSALGHKLRPKILLAAACWLTILAAGVLVIGDGRTAAVWVGAVMMGLATAPQFPAMFTYLERRIRMTGNATAWMVGAAGLGGLVFPWLIGQWFDASGPSALPWSMLGLGVLTLASFGVSNRKLGG
jgi:FHS family Na+ dependent glucose MFS transporter 1